MKNTCCKPGDKCCAPPVVPAHAGEEIFRVEGMDRSEEISAIERSVKPLSGVISVRANLTASTLRQFDFAKKSESYNSKLSVMTFYTSAALFCAVALHAEDDDAPVPTGADGSARYGLFNGLDHRSSYGQDIYQEPFLVDDTNKEENEVRLDWLYSRAAGRRQNNGMTAEFSHAIGNVTFQLEAPYEIDNAPARAAHGWDDMAARARCPLFEAVAPGGFADSTFGVATEVGIPLNTVFSKNTELLPQVFNNSRIGKFTIQSLFGYSMLFGPGGNEGGLRSFQYGFSLGYAIEKPWAQVAQFAPVFELAGEKDVNKDQSNSLTGGAGIRISLAAIGKLEPKLGIGYVFPVDRATGQELHNGIYTVFGFDF